MTIYNPRPEPSGDLTKLPQWAQRYINSLVQFLDGIERTKRRLEGDKIGDEPVTALVYLEGYTAEPVKAGPYVRVEFAQSTPQGRRADIYVSVRDGAVRIEGQTAFSIDPESSNAATIKPRDW